MPTAPPHDHDAIRMASPTIPVLPSWQTQMTVLGAAILSREIRRFRGRWRWRSAFGGAGRRDEALFDEALADAFEDAERLQESLHRQGEGEFDDRLQFAVLAALHGFEAVKFEAHDAVDDRHLFQSIAEICGHSQVSLRCNATAAPRPSFRDARKP